jgi:hypothetical protein
MEKIRQTLFIYVIVIKRLTDLNVDDRLKPKKAAGYRQPSSEKEKR